MSSRILQLEHTVMELGTEMYRLKHEISRLSEVHEQFLKSMRGLKLVLDERGVISTEDFEAAVDIAEIMEQNFNAPDAGHMREIERLKKTSH